MANSFLKPTVIISTALGLLLREIVLPNLVWSDAVPDWSGAANDTVSIRLPARATARTRSLRGGRPITMDDLTETKVDVTLADDVYHASAITDEQLTLDIRDFGVQVLAPQVRGVAEGLENVIATCMTGSAPAIDLPIDTTDPYATAVDARKALNDANVPFNGRSLVCGSEIEAMFLKSDRFVRANESGSTDALRDAKIGRVAGFDVFTSNAIPSDKAFAFHKTAYVLGIRAPKVPDGATFGASQSYMGMAMRWLRDYDFVNVQDRSLVDAFVGATAVEDGPGDTLVRAVEIHVGV